MYRGIETEEQRQAFLEMQEANLEFRRSYKKQFYQIIFFIIVLAIFIKLYFGKISIKLETPLSNPTYDLKINDINMELHVKTSVTSTLIPFFMEINKYNSHSRQGFSDEFLIKLGEAVLLDFQTYICFSSITGKAKLIGCTNNPNNKRLINTDNINLKITDSNNFETIYDGVFIKDISQYINQFGKYKIEITEEHSGMISTMESYVTVK